MTNSKLAATSKELWIKTKVGALFLITVGLNNFITASHPTFLTITSKGTLKRNFTIRPPFSRSKLALTFNMYYVIHRVLLCVRFVTVGTYLTARISTYSFKKYMFIFYGISAEGLALKRAELLSHERQVQYGRSAGSFVYSGVRPLDIFLKFFSLRS